MGGILSTSSKKAGHDVITKHIENKTHFEVNTRHIYSKTAGFHLFDVHQEGSGDGIRHPGMTGIGIIGEILLFCMGIAILCWVAKKIMAYRVRHDSYKGFYRTQVSDSPFALAVPPPAQNAGEYYGPNNKRHPNRDLDRLHNEVKELKMARRTLEAHLALTGQAKIQPNGSSAASAPPKAGFIRKSRSSDSD